MDINTIKSEKSMDHDLDATFGAVGQNEEFDGVSKNFIKHLNYI